MLPDLPSSGSTVHWDGLTPGEPYERYRSSMKVQDLNLVTKTTLIDGNKQVPAATRLSIFVAHNQPGSTARKVLDRINLFKATHTSLH